MSPTPRSLPLLFITLLLFPVRGAEGQSQPAITLHGELRPRAESQDPGESFLISSRTRFSLDVAFEEGFRLFIQPQDVRTWGEETGERDRSAEAVDFHQAFLEVVDLPGAGGRLRAGRQEVSVAESRFLAAPNWGQAGQTFDGIRWIRSLGGGRLDVTYLAIREEAAEAHTRDGSFWAAWLTQPLGSFGSLDLLAFRDDDATGEAFDQYTVGTVWKGSYRPLAVRVQGMRQLGRREDRDVSAYMLAAEARLSFLDEKGSVTLWYDHLSGDENRDDGEATVFSTLYGARNRFYGRADYFTDIPLHTGGLGLRDAALKLSYRPVEVLSVNLDLHAFCTAEPDVDDARDLARELDIWVRYRFRDRMDIQTGYSLTRAGSVMERLDRLQGMGHFGYLMTSMAF